MKKCVKSVLRLYTTRILFKMRSFQNIYVSRLKHVYMYIHIHIYIYSKLLT